jgi:hypothetical protein
VNGTVKISNEGHLNLTISPHRALPASAELNLQARPWVIGWRELLALPENLWCASLPASGARAPKPERSLAAVAYCLLKTSWLAYSPNLGSNVAYHTMIRGLEEYTNLRGEKRIGGLSGPRPATPFSVSDSPVARAGSPFLRLPAGDSPASNEVIVIHSGKRAKYMSNLPFAVPLGAGDQPRSHSQSCGALAAQTCPAPAPATPGPSTPPAIPLPEKTVSPPPEPLRSARCSEKGCVFPAPSPDHPKCHYHELLQSGAEAELLESRQPSYLLLLYAPFGIPDAEPDDSRQQDRQRQSAEREQFLLDQFDEAP